MTGKRTVLALAGALLAFLAQGAAAAPTFEVISNSASKAELRFHNIGLVARRADDAQNQLGLNFDGAVDPELYDSLQRALPDWIESAFGAHDNAVIRARHPVIFETRAESDGFSLRITPREPVVRTSEAAQPPQRLEPPQTFEIDPRPTGATAQAGCTNCPNPNGVALRGSNDGHSAVRRLIVVSLVERLDDQNLMLALSLAARQPPIASLWGGFRQNKGGALRTAGGRFAFPVLHELKIIGGFGYTAAEGTSVRRLSGARAPFSDHAIKGTAGLAFEFGSGELAGEAEIGPEGVGGIVTAAVVSSDSYFTAKAAYHEHYEDTVEAVAMGATRNHVSATIAQDLGAGLWIDGEIRAASYGVKGDSYIGKTLGFAAGLRYLTDFSGIPATFSYRVDADYVLDSDKYPGVAPTPFVPLSLRNREVHRLSAGFTFPLIEDMWFDMHAGYAVDRYGASGAFAGGQFRTRLIPGVQLIAAGRYSAVSARIGERGPESLFSLSLNLSEQ